jgi:hypothetical protein
MLTFGPGATDPWRFEEYARKMFPKYSRLNVPTRVIDPALGTGPLPDRPADILRPWLTRAPLSGYDVPNSTLLSSDLRPGI